MNRNRVNWHKPYYHISEHNNQNWLFDYQELKPLALVLTQDQNFVQILYKASDEILKFYNLPADYNPSEVSVDLSKNFSSHEVGFINTWRIESENKVAGSGRTYSLTRENPQDNWRLTHRNTFYEIANSAEISDLQKLIKISSKYEPYLELQILNSWPEGSDQYSRTDDIYKDILISYGSILWFPAWRIFGEEVNKIVPSALISVPGYGVSSGSDAEEPVEDFSYNIPTGSDNVNLKLQNKDKTYFKANIRNGCLVFEGDEELELFTSLSLSDGLSFQLEFYLPEIQEWEVSNRLVLFESKEAKISLIPYIEAETFLDSYFTTEYTKAFNSFVLVLENNSGDFAVFCKIFETKQWYTFSFDFFTDSFVFENNRLKINNSEGTILGNTGNKPWENLLKFSDSIILFKGMKTVIKEVKVSVYGSQIRNPLGHFIDYRMIDYYQLRSCNPSCPWALPRYNKELKRDIYEPKKLLDRTESQINVCPFVESGFDPFRKINASICSGTSLVSINANYPQEFSESEIQSPHYKVEISVDSEPFSENSLIDESTCEFLYNTFEEWRPVARAANYELSLELKTDFTGNGFSLFSDSGFNNWLLRATIADPTFSDCWIYNTGDSGFSSPKDLWLITHNLKTTHIVGQAFTAEKKLLYANNQVALNDYNYCFDFSPNRYSGFSLLNRASSYKAFDLLTTRPFFVQTGKGNSSAAILQVKNPDNYRQEIENFLAIPWYLRTEILELFESGTVLLSDCDVMYYVSEYSRVWLIEHNSGVIGQLVQVYDENWKALKPSEVILLDNNRLQLRFDTEVKGTVGLKHIGNPFWKQELIDTIYPKEELIDGKIVKTSGYFLLGNFNGTNGINWSYGSEFSSKEFSGNKTMQSEKTVRVEITNFYENENEYVFVGTVPAFRSLNDLQVCEIGLFNRFNNLCFYALGTLVHVVKEFSFNITFKISKEPLVLEQRNAELECKCEDCELLQQNDCLDCDFRNQCPMRLDRLLKEVRND